MGWQFDRRAMEPATTMGDIILFIAFGYICIGQPKGYTSRNQFHSMATLLLNKEATPVA